MVRTRMVRFKMGMNQTSKGLWTGSTSSKVIPAFCTDHIMSGADVLVPQLATSRNTKLRFAVPSHSSFAPSFLAKSFK
jgi:hypothetical protein